MALPLFIVDAFADRPFTGNPAAVCLLDGPRDEAWMQALAGEMNLSETAFVVPEEGGFGLRWFTPKVEVALCGHATLASAHVLYETSRVRPGETVRFRTKSGELTVKPADDGLEMDFPAVRAEPCEHPPGLAVALGAEARFVGRNGMDYLVELPDEPAVRALAPDMARLTELPVRGVIVTAASDRAGVDFVSRFFAPRSGVPEDPVTGSAHCALGPHWMAKLGKADLIGYQASPRGGFVRVGVRGDRVLLGGRAVTVVRGSLAVALPD
jgi:PhzF family phenazine biosynthesis protein